MDPIVIVILHEALRRVHVGPWRVDRITMLLLGFDAIVVYSKRRARTHPPSSRRAIANCIVVIPHTGPGP